MASPVSGACVQVALPAAGSGGLARHQRLRLCDDDFTGELLPQYQDKVISLSTPARLGELALMLWLVIKGSKPQPLYAVAQSSVAD